MLTIESVVKDAATEAAEPSRNGMEIHLGRLFGSASPVNVSLDPPHDFVRIDPERATSQVLDVVLPVGRHEAGPQPVGDRRLITAESLSSRGLGAAEMIYDVFGGHGLYPECRDYGHAGPTLSTGIPIGIAVTVEPMDLDERKAAGARAFELRKKREKTQQELAQDAGLDQSSISDFERGNVTDPSFEFVYKLAKALRSSTEYIFFGREHDLDTETLEFAYAFQRLSREKRARWTSTLLLQTEGIGDKEVEQRLLKGKLPPTEPPEPPPSPTPPAVPVTQLHAQGLRRRSSAPPASKGKRRGRDD